MSTAQASSTGAALDALIDDLRTGARALQHMSLDRRIELIKDCIDGVGSVARDWVEAACEAKQIPTDSPARMEEVTAGPLATIRFLQLVLQTFKDIGETGRPRLPGQIAHVHGQCRVPVFPTPLLYDSLLFKPMTAETWLHPDVQPDAVSALGTARILDSQREPNVAAVLGAGNVSSIPITDALTKILIEKDVVALKMNPVNEYLGPFFQAALKPLIDSGLFRLAYGGIETGSYLVQHEQTDSVHITGSIHSHDNIVWGTGDDREARRTESRPLLTKTITSELGNVTPWAIVPGKYSDRELRAQTELIANSIVNNVSFNCIATKVILVSRDWPQRIRFHDLLSELLQKIPTRIAYYPGAAQRFETFSGQQPVNPQRLPWILLRDIDPRETPYLLHDESFAPVCAELVIDANSDVDFLGKSVDIMNDQIWGTLAANITVPSDFQRDHAANLDSAIRNLRYGTISINQWSALSFALMSPPWGGHPSSTLTDAQSGLGFVHNTYLLDRPEKTVLRAPLIVKPKPIWNTNHRHPERVAWDLLNVYRKPSLLRMPALFLSSFTG